MSSEYNGKSFLALIQPSALHVLVGGNRVSLLGWNSGIATKKMDHQVSSKMDHGIPYENSAPANEVAANSVEASSKLLPYRESRKRIFIVLDTEVGCAWNLSDLPIRRCPRRSTA